MVLTTKVPMSKSRLSDSCYRCSPTSSEAFSTCTPAPKSVTCSAQRERPHIDLQGWASHSTSPAPKLKFAYATAWQMSSLICFYSCTARRLPRTARNLQTERFERCDASSAAGKLCRGASLPRATWHSSACQLQKVPPLKLPLLRLLPEKTAPVRLLVRAQPHSRLLVHSARVGKGSPRALLEVLDGKPFCVTFAVLPLKLPYGYAHATSIGKSANSTDQLA